MTTLKSIRSLLAIAFAFALTPAWAERLPFEAARTLPEVQASVSAVKDDATRQYLQSWVSACGNQRWGSCQAAWWDMLTKGGLSRVSDPENGFVYYAYKDNDEAANKALSDMLGLFELSPLAKSAWQMEVTTDKQLKGMPRITQGQRILLDSSEAIAVMRIVDQRFKERAIKVNFKERMDSDRLEWLRLVSLMYAIRDDTNSAYDALSQLQKGVVAEGSDAQAVAAYNLTVKAVETYLKKKDTGGTQ